MSNLEMLQRLLDRQYEIIEVLECEIQEALVSASEIKSMIRAIQQEETHKTKRGLYRDGKFLGNFSSRKDVSEAFDIQLPNHLVLIYANSEYDTANGEVFVIGYDQKKQTFFEIHFVTVSFGKPEWDVKETDLTTMQLQWDNLKPQTGMCIDAYRYLFEEYLME